MSNAKGRARRPSAQRLRVLVVDDQEAIRSLLGRVLSRHGCHVVGQAAHGREAIALAMAKEPDLVIMDSQMPHMDGIQATRLITRRLPTTTVVGFTSTEGASLLQAGAVEVFDKSELQRLVQTYCPPI